jgi:hypothetical protein
MNVRHANIFVLVAEDTGRLANHLPMERQGQLALTKCVRHTPADLGIRRHHLRHPVLVQRAVTHDGNPFYLVRDPLCEGVDLGMIPVESEMPNDHLGICEKYVNLCEAVTGQQFTDIDVAINPKIIAFNKFRE